MNTPISKLWSTGTLALSLALASGGCIDAVIGDLDVCKYDGRGHSIGERFPATDGCNTCSCDKTGDVSCTEIACSSDAGSGSDAGAGTCSYGGKLYKLGESFRDTDDCNTCSCTEQGVACTSTDCIATCKQGDRTYLEGQSFPSADGCNTCTCGRYSGITCTDKACSDPCSVPDASGALAPECGVCSYGGKTYSAGESFPATDGCNTCTCADNGSVGCTKIGCPSKTCDFNGKVYQVGDSFQDELGCNACSCSESGVFCTARWCDPAQACKRGDRYSFASGNSTLCPDGCNSCLCNEGSWASTDRACGALPRVERCTGVEGGAPKARVLYLEGDALALEVGMGGCANTTPGFKLCFDGAFAESLPVQARLRIVPDEVSACSAWTTQQKVFDISPLREDYRAAYRSNTGQISVQLPGDNALYSF